MKKILFYLACICVVFCSINVNATCAAGVSANNEWICLVTGASQANSTGTLYPEGTTLVMKNYNGGQISYSSGLGNPGVPLKIKLIGDNYITANDSFGLRVPLSGVEFVGDGTLTITSKAPISVYDCNTAQDNNQVYLSDTVSTVKILAGNKVEEETSETVEVDDNSNSSEEVVETNNNDVNWTLVFGAVCCGISVICLVVVVVVLLSNKKNKKEA